MRGEAATERRVRVMENPAGQGPTLRAFPQQKQREKRQTSETLRHGQACWVRCHRQAVSMILLKSVYIGVQPRVS